METKMGEGRAKRQQPELEFCVTDLEQELRGPEGGQKRLDLLDRLRALDERITATMKGGVSPAEFKKDQILREALACARGVVVRFR